MTLQPAPQATRTHLLLRPWLPAGTPSALAWDSAPSPAPWLPMLREAIERSGGTLLPSPTILPTILPTGLPAGLLAARFPTVPQAFTAARRLQTLVTGYADGHAAPRQPGLFALTLLLAAFPAASNTPAPESAQGLELQLAAQIASWFAHWPDSRPAQILLAHPAAVPLPPFLHSAPLPAPLPRDFALHYILHDLPWHHQPQAAASAATALQRSEQAQQPKPAPRPPEPLSPFTAPRLAHRLFGQTSAWRNRLPPASTLRALTPARRAALLAAIALALILPAALLLHRPAKPRPTPATSTPIAPPISTPSVQVPARKMPAPPKPALQTPSAAEKPDKPGMQDHPTHLRGDLTLDQLRQILNRGQSALDRGCNQQAIAYFRRVLDDDPRNPTATAGLEKARVRIRLTNSPDTHPACTQ